MSSNGQTVSGAVLVAISNSMKPWTKAPYSVTQKYPGGQLSKVPEKAARQAWEMDQKQASTQPRMQPALSPSDQDEPDPTQAPYKGSIRESPETIAKRENYFARRREEKRNSTSSSSRSSTSPRNSPNKVTKPVARKQITASPRHAPGKMTKPVAPRQASKKTASPAKKVTAASNRNQTIPNASKKTVKPAASTLNDGFKYADWMETRTSSRLQAKAVMDQQVDDERRLVREKNAAVEAELEAGDAALSAVGESPLTMRCPGGPCWMYMRNSGSCFHSVADEEETEASLL